MAIITEDYVSLEIAKLLKEKGFNEECEYFYDEYDENEYVICSNGGSAYNDDEHPTYYSMPTLQMAMKWLREVHNLYIQIEVTSWPQKGYFVHIYMYDDRYNDFKDSSYVKHMQSYENACEAAIKYCLENLI